MFPGGMGVNRFLNEAWKNGMYDMTYEEAQELRSAWFEAFPEMDLHMAPSTCAAPSRGDNDNLYEAHTTTGRTRRFCSYNAACNFPLTCSGSKMR